MRSTLSATLLLLLLAGGGYWYYDAALRCPVPLAYAIGELDERFGLSQEEAAEQVEEVVARWEEHTGRDLFVYDSEHADLTINFVYDGRQKLTEDEHALREVLMRAENVSESIRGAYTELLAQYEALRERYDARLATYEAALASYNAEVAHWNDEGGAPEEVYEELREREGALAVDGEELGVLAAELNRLVDRLNTLGEQGNEAVRDYNNRVTDYNDRFNHEREFTQGDYQDGRITIYQFADREELALVLAHELGHALGLGHVEDPTAVLYYLMEGQDTVLSFTEADLVEFERVCGA